jgi:hypothetical protein
VLLSHAHSEAINAKPGWRAAVPAQGQAAAL